MRPAGAMKGPDLCEWTVLAFWRVKYALSLDHRQVPCLPTSGRRYVFRSCEYAGLKPCGIGCDPGRTAHKPCRSWPSGAGVRLFRGAVSLSSSSDRAGPVRLVRRVSEGGTVANGTIGRGSYTGVAV